MERIRRTSSGFGLIELMLSLGVTALIVAGAYQVSSKTLQKGAVEMQNGVARADTARFLDRFNTEVANTISLTSDADTASSVLGNLNSADVFFPSGISSYPGFSFKEMDDRSNLTPIAPGSVNLTCPSNSDAIADLPADSACRSDAIRLAFLANDSDPVFLATDPNSDESNPRPYLTSQADDPSRGIIVVEKGNLEIGDFAMIQDDGNQRDLFRITGIEEFDNGEGDLLFRIYHSPSVSNWNLPFNRDYGQTGSGNAFIQEVEVVTYAHDPLKKIVYRDNHVEDDGFNPTSKTFVGTPGLKKNWAVALKNVDSFKIFYAQEGLEKPIANPNASDAGDKGDIESGFPGNQLGDPNLRRIALQVGQDKATFKDERTRNTDTVTDSVERGFRPENLLRSYAQGENSDLTGPAVFLTRTPTPEPSVTPTATPAAGGTPPPVATGTPAPTPTPPGAGGGSGGF